MTNTAYQENFMMLVITAVTPPFQRFQLRELLLPVPQNMRFHATQFADFANGEVALGRNGRQINGRFAGAHGRIRGHMFVLRRYQTLISGVPACSTTLFSFWLA